MYGRREKNEIYIHKLFTIMHMITSIENGRGQHIGGAK